METLNESILDQINTIFKMSYGPNVRPLLCFKNKFSVTFNNKRASGDRLSKLGCSCIQVRS